MQGLVFYVLATIAVASALMVVWQRRTIYSALSLIVCLGSIAGLFFQLGSEFLGAVQIIVYAGAIMVLFLFVIMLVDPESEIFGSDRRKRIRVMAIPLAALFSFILFEILARQTQVGTGTIARFPAGTKAIAHSLFRDYLLPFEVTSVLILVAILGAIVLAKRPD